MINRSQIARGSPLRWAYGVKSLLRTSWLAQVFASFVGSQLYAAYIETGSASLKSFLAFFKELFLNFSFEQLTGHLSQTRYPFLVLISMVLIVRLSWYFYKKYKELGLVRRSGLISFLDNSSSKEREEIERQLKEDLSKEDDIKILGATGVNTFGKSDSFLHDIITKANGKIEIVLLDPDKNNRGLIERADQLNSSVAQFQQEIIESVLMLQGLERQGKHITLYFYHHLPQWKLYITSNRLWLQYYEPGRHVENSQIFGIERNNGRTFYSYFSNLFNRKIRKLEKEKYKVDLLNWPNVIQESGGLPLNSTSTRSAPEVA